MHMHVNNARFIGRPQKSKALIESWAPYFTHFCFYEVMHYVSLQVLKDDERHSIAALFLQSSFNIQ